MVAWVARLAVRRVVWIVVGLAVFAVLGAMGVRAAEGDDVALAGTASASSTYSGSYPASNAIDGSDATTWASAGTVAGEWVAVDLGSVLPVGSARTETQGCTSSLQWSADGSTGWTTVATGFGVASTSTVDSGAVAFSTVEARYWRLLSTACNGTYLDYVHTLSLFEGAPASSFSCDPSCVVEFSQDDRDRLDLQTFTTATVGAVSLFCLGVIAVATVLKR